MLHTRCAALLALALLGLGCNESALKTAPDGGAEAYGLTAEQAAQPLAKIGDRVITLGDFARTLDRMDQFDRLRYQTKERRRELLSDIIDVELLAAEARRRGLDKQAETQDAVRQILRDAMLAKARQGLPVPAEIPAADIKAFYDRNPEMFSEPERRRATAIVLSDAKDAKKVLDAALKAKNAAEWGEIYEKHSINAPKGKGASGPADLAGDLGMVGPPDDPKGANPKVPEPVRAALFKIGNIGETLGELVEADGKLYIVRLSGRTAPHTRTLQEADRSIRVAILQQKMQEQEKALEQELRKKFPVEIDEKALAATRIPSALMNLDAGSGASPWAKPGEAPAAADAGAPSGPGDAGP